MKEKNLIEILNELKETGESYSGKNHYWLSEKWDDEGNKYTLIIADIEREKYMEQLTYKVKEL